MAMKRRTTTTTKVEEVLDTSVDLSAGTSIPGQHNRGFLDRDYTSSVGETETETTGSGNTEEGHLPLGRTPSDLVAGYQTSWRGMATILTLASFAMCLAFFEIKDVSDWLVKPIVISLVFWIVWFGFGKIEEKWKQD